MRRFATLAAASAASLALVAPAAVLTATTASAAPSSASASTADAPTVLARKAKIKLKKSKAGTHYGLAGNKITAQVRGKGKVTFSVNGTKLGKKKIKKGKASVRLPSDLAPGTYKVKAKFKKSKATIKTVVWDSALNVNTAVFTVSAAGYDFPEMGGQVKFKGKIAKKGWVDIYLDGKNKGGSSSPNYCCMASVSADGTFNFSGYSFLGKVAEEWGVGTHQFRAQYTPTASFSDYIYSQWITVTVTP
ncbi:hypothetical protein [Nocardioides houyundeii]|uniref:hypothetical protein n=1 Tax=Nocardioides houyundeii TaxID=2045452 RepID=UPI000DF14CC6|nr:hypothetical protein [Nocardioides houyundeii]